ncbi:MAG: DUF4974 domain-containing protein [Bacteroidota bacterium]|nr:DUF4974 domain-containing protein [Bacteroidota bacterium]MDP4273280.1 DUF4974 domain-containing protein [Bacteroidota bacterium]
MFKNDFWRLAGRKLAGEATDKDLSRLSGLTDRDPHKAEKLRILDDIWKSEIPVPDSSISRTAFEKLKVQIESDQRDSYPKKENRQVKKSIDFAVIYKMAAVLVVILSAFFGIYKLSQKTFKSFAPTEKYVERVNSKGVKACIILSDGTTVWLNADSRLKYPEEFKGNKREVYLEGEAFFDVIKNPNAPFIVKTSEIEIKVLGTSFNVSCYPDEANVTTTLVRGKVIIQKETNKSITTEACLMPNQSAIFNRKDKKIILKKVDSRINSSWKNGKLVFSDESMDEVVKKLERWYNVKIVLKDKELKKYSYTATFEGESMEKVLKLLEISAPITYTIARDTLITLMRKK